MFEEWQARARSSLVLSHSTTPGTETPHTGSSSTDAGKASTGKPSPGNPSTGAATGAAAAATAAATAQHVPGDEGEGEREAHGAHRKPSAGLSSADHGKAAGRVGDQKGRTCWFLCFHSIIFSASLLP